MATDTHGPTQTERDGGPEVGGRRSEVGGRRAKGKGRKSEIRGRRSEGKGPRDGSRRSAVGGRQVCIGLLEDCLDVLQELRNRLDVHAIIVAVCLALVKEVALSGWIVSEESLKTL